MFCLTRLWLNDMYNKLFWVLDKQICYLCFKPVHPFVFLQKNLGRFLQESSQTLYPWNDGDITPRCSTPFIFQIPIHHVWFLVYHRPKVVNYISMLPNLQNPPQWLLICFFRNQEYITTSGSTLAMESVFLLPSHDWLWIMFVFSLWEVKLY